jgi:hypothetical protein
MLQFIVFDMFRTANFLKSVVHFHDIAQTAVGFRPVFVGTSAAPSIFKREVFYSKDGP